MASFDFDKYRVDQYGTVYEWLPKKKEYLCLGKKLPGETDHQAILRILIDRDENGGPEV